ncbi:hypothetical protein SAMN04489732_117111 [Amycolatopsis saalfeldensis]|uniref:Uncharacterized protein n=1 Tax=Amycolatopsis saalfeldensis TaxID=394193 RepID=A0A1H8YIA0_9PSEU|nr:hypothetical protein SAMN04489732_117111 [Amycolatopsis saalfeldensis]
MEVHLTVRGGGVGRSATLVESGVEVGDGTVAGPLVKSA